MPASRKSKKNLSKKRKNIKSSKKTRQHMKKMRGGGINLEQAKNININQKLRFKISGNDTIYEGTVINTIKDLANRMDRVEMDINSIIFEIRFVADNNEYIRKFLFNEVFGDIEILEN